MPMTFHLQAMPCLNHYLFNLCFYPHSHVELFINDSLCISSSLCVYRFNRACHICVALPVSIMNATLRVSPFVSFVWCQHLHEILQYHTRCVGLPVRVRANVVDNSMPGVNPYMYRLICGHVDDRIIRSNW
eukprot:823559_1